ncbi:MAG: hypothetical protein IJ170_06025 [Ruminococcus sp.]|nr:hypothetical protein [Ruminococcus sp.]
MEDIFMKRFAAASVLLSAALLLCGCSSGTAASSEESSSKAERVSSSPIDPKIIGEWTNGSNGFIFGEDRKVSLPMDVSSMFYFKDGGLIMADDGKTCNKPEFDGQTLKVTYEDENYDEPVSVLEMERHEKGSPSQFDGEYDLTGGVYFNVFLSNFSISEENADIDAIVEGETVRLVINDYCSYETLGGKSLEMFSPDMDYVDDTATAVKYTYKVDGDTLTLTYEDQEPQTYTRVK